MHFFWQEAQMLITSAILTHVDAMHFHFPSPALPGSGRMGMISARYIKAPPMISGKGKSVWYYSNLKALNISFKPYLLSTHFSPSTILNKTFQSGPMCGKPIALDK